MSKTTNKYILRGILTLIGIAAAIALYFVLAYAYLYVYAAFTWQCNIYVGEKTPEAVKVCNDFNSGGLWKVLTN